MNILAFPRRLRMSGKSSLLHDKRLDGFDGFVENAMKDWQVPGLALSIVEGDRMVKVTFHTDAKGVVSTLTAPMEPAVRDMVFTRRA
jgi:hypothetical protein